MKTTVDIADSLLARAKEHARRTGRPLRALLEEGLRRVLEDAPEGPPYRMPDCSVGDPRAANPLEAVSWQELRDGSYCGSSAR